jgi:hypothetical protein
VTEEIIEKGIIRTTRKLIPIGGSVGVTLPRTWLKIQEYLGEELTEMISIANHIIILAPPGKEEKALKILRRIEAEGD